MGSFLNAPGVAEQIAPLLLPSTVMQLRLSARFGDGELNQQQQSSLWGLLDDVDTLGDSIRPSTLEEFRAYYSRVNDIVAKRFQILSVGPDDELRPVAQRFVRAAPAPAPAPVPIRIHCPECHALHIDLGVWATKPHHTHSRQSCGNTWRPAAVDTVGAQFLPGFKNDD